MTRLDRYILRQMVAACGFFVLIFTGVVWLTQAVRLIDTVLASGQTARVFLEFSALVLPQVFVIVLPLAGLGAALYALDKLYTDSELIVMMGAGLGPAAMLRPVALFGGLIAIAMALVMMVLVPRSGAILAERTRAIRSDLANSLIVERQFLHPIPGLTLFITDTSRQGEMAGIFLDDERDPAQPVTYSARRARLLSEGNEARLVMEEGVALSPAAGGSQLTAVRFDQFVFDLSDLINEQDARIPRPSEYPVTALLHPTPQMLAGGHYDLAAYVSEGHYKISLPLLAMTYPMIALVTLLAGGYRRSGFGRRVVLAIAMAAFLQIIMFAVRARVEERAELWPLMYLPLLLGVALPRNSPVQAQSRPPPEDAAGMTLWRYILRGFLRSVLAVFAVLALVIVLFTLVENLRRYGESGAHTGDVIRITLLQAPEVLYQVFPLVLMLASLITFLRFARSSELVVMRASGVAALRLIAVPVIAAIVLGVVFVAVVNPFVAASIKRGEAVEDDFGKAGSSLLSFSKEGVWLRQADPDGQTVIQAARTNADGTILTKVRMHRFDKDGTLYARIEAPAARLTDGSWLLENATEWHLDADGSYGRTAANTRINLPTMLTSDEILQSFAPPETVGFWDLGRFIAQMEESGFSGLRHRLFLQSELAKPALFAAMVLIGSAFALRPARFGQTGVMILLAVLAGFALYFLKDFAELLGGQGDIPLLVAAWAPPVAAILLALSLLLHLEDG